jgi:hypothetical protein
MNWANHSPEILLLGWHGEKHSLGAHVPVESLDIVNGKTQFDLPSAVLLGSRMQRESGFSRYETRRVSHDLFTGGRGGLSISRAGGAKIQLDTVEFRRILIFKSRVLYAVLLVLPLPAALLSNSARTLRANSIGRNGFSR